MKKISLPHYSITKQLKTTNNGKTFLATHNFTKNKVIVEVIHKLKTYISNDFGDIVNELEIAKHFEHPNLFNLIDLYEDAKRYFIISEYHKGVPLGEYVCTRGPFKSLETITKLFSQLMKVLQFLQSNSFYHGNIDPNFIVVDQELNLKLKLFGYEQLTGNKKDGEFNFSRNGNYEFISPELQSSAPILSPACDVWSLGTILYFCLTPKYFFNQERQTSEKLHNGIFQAQLPKWVPKELQTLLDRMISLDHTQRITIQEILKTPFFSNLQEPNNRRSRKETVGERSKRNIPHIDPKILCKAKLSGLNVKKIVVGLLKKEYNSLTAIYRNWHFQHEQRKHIENNTHVINPEQIQEMELYLQKCEKELALKQKNKEKEFQNPILVRQQRLELQRKEINMQFKTLTVLLNPGKSSNTDDDNTFDPNHNETNMKTKKKKKKPTTKTKNNEKMKKKKSSNNQKYLIYNKGSLDEKYREMLNCLENKKVTTNNLQTTIRKETKIKKQGSLSQKKRKKIDNNKKYNAFRQNYNDYLKTILKGKENKPENRYSPRQLKRIQRKMPKKSNHQSSHKITYNKKDLLKRSKTDILSLINNNNPNNDRDGSGKGNFNRHFPTFTSTKEHAFNHSKSCDQVNIASNNSPFITKSENNKFLYQINELESLDIDEILNSTISPQPRKILLRQYLNSLKELDISFKKINKYKYYCKAPFKKQVLKFNMMIVKLPNQKMLNRVKFLRIRCDIGTFYSLLKQIESHLEF
ncbi:map/microtubule affinity-regulating kinase [Anaeramoeba flamelloides]|uniref:non-specific serine/threonine protein kinase n=1 Tax=Anaeramoeba flamelloides TaxID=1746091 RepID=A0ABQ8XEX9_9EUKA|nr:map/microtubule affinity-regulating kinase [Anaeramoeba flamelloides]